MKNTETYTAKIMDCNGNFHTVTTETAFVKRIAEMSAGAENICRKDFAKGKDGAEQFKQYKSMVANIWRATANLRAAIDNGSSTEETADQEKTLYITLKPFFRLCGTVNGKNVFHPDKFTASRLLNRAGETVHTILFTDSAKAAKVTLDEKRQAVKEKRQALNEAEETAKILMDESSALDVQNALMELRDAEADVKQAAADLKKQAAKIGGSQKQAETAGAERFRKNFELFLMDMLIGRVRKSGDVIAAEQELAKTQERLAKTNDKVTELVETTLELERKIEDMESTLEAFSGTVDNPVWEAEQAEQKTEKTA